MDAPITDEELVEMAGNIAPGYYLKLGVKLGHKLARLEQILQSKNNDYLRSIVAILMTWRDLPRQGESWRTKRSRLSEIFSSVGIKTLSDELLTASQSSEQVAAKQSVSIPEPVIGLSDAVLEEIAENLETDEQMESLARALGRTRTHINQCHATNRLTGSVTIKGTVEMLTSWKATVQPEIQMSSMRSAMTLARLLYLRDTVLVKAEKEQEQEKQNYQRQLLLQQQQQQLQHPRPVQQQTLQQQVKQGPHQQLEEHQSLGPAESHQEMISRGVQSLEGDSSFSSLCSVDPGTAEYAGRLEEARRRIVVSKQRNAPPYQPEPSASSTSASFQRQQAFYDIYLYYSQETEHVLKVKDIIQSNGWTMITPADSRLGVPKMVSIQEALKTCSHVILVLRKEDCDKNDLHQTMTIEMRFQLSAELGLDSHVISIRCCEENCLPLSLRSLRNLCITDVNLEEKLKNNIDVGRKKQKEEGLLGPWDFLVEGVYGSPCGTSLTQTSSTHPTGEAIASPASFDASNQSLTASQVASQIEQPFPQINQTSSFHLTGEATAPPATLDTSNQSLTASQVASQIGQLLPQINQLSTAPNCLLNIQGNVYNIGSMQYAGIPGATVPLLTVVPPAVRHELSKRLNGPRVTHDDWRGLACALNLDGYIDGLNHKPDPTGDVISIAEEQKKLCSLEDLRGILEGMKRDDCVEILDDYQHRRAAGESGNRLMITDRDRGSSSSDEF